MLTSLFLDNIKLGFYVLAALSIVTGAIHVLLSNEKSNLDEPRVKINRKTFTQFFFFPTKNARDFYLALVGKLLMVMGGTVVMLYQLYILTDYMGLSRDASGKVISNMALITMILGIIFGVIAGPLSDRFHRVKAPVALSTIFLGIAAFFPFIQPEPWTMYVFAVMSGIGNGVYNSVDGALNLAVLPSNLSAGKDLGIINFANTLSQILGTVFASAIVSLIGFRAIFPAALAINVLGGLLIFAIKKVK